ncbi:MAG: complex I subunit 5 family protein [Wenzhouxiangellaceae bacterium]
MSVLLPLVAPLLLIVLLNVPGRACRVAIRLAPLASLPLLWPVIAPATIELPDLLLGLKLGADAISRPLLLLTAIVWTLAAWLAQARVHEARLLFWGGWLTSLAGLSLMLLARDIAAFYIGYATLSLASWLLIVHAREPESWRAGRIYLVMALIGEMAVFAAIMKIASVAGNIELAELARQPLLAGPWAFLALAGFAVKMGIVPLHLWLPLAHPVAPVPASAVLSGVIVKAGLLGWLRLLPPGTELPPAAWTFVIALGLATAFAGVLLGLCQSRPKVVLAYSTISQMGLVLAAWAAMMLGPDPAAMLPWLGVLVLHHGLNKAALFMACGCAPGRSRLRMLFVALPALALAAAPLTTGALAKTGIKTVFGEGGLGDVWIVLLSLSSVATAVLLWRFWKMAGQMRQYRTAHPAWLLITVLAMLLPWLWALWTGLPLLKGLLAVVSSAWPLLLAFALVVLWRLRGPTGAIELPAGDLVVALERLVARLAPLWFDPPRPGFSRGPISLPPTERFRRRLTAIESRITTVPLAGFLILAIGGLIWLVAWWAGISA